MKCHRHVFTHHPEAIRIEGHTRKDNYAMRKVFFKCGYVREACYRKAWPSRTAHCTIRSVMGSRGKIGRKTKSPVDWGDVRLTKSSRKTPGALPFPPGTASFPFLPSTARLRARNPATGAPPIGFRLIAQQKAPGMARRFSQSLFPCSTTTRVPKPPRGFQTASTFMYLGFASSTRSLRIRLVACS